MKRATATALSCVVLGWFYFTYLDDHLARQIAYPFNYKEEVIAAAEKEQVPPSLVASVILAESKYKNTAESETGALGLMQLMPERLVGWHSKWGMVTIQIVNLKSLL